MKVIKGFKHNCIVVYNKYIVILKVFINIKVLNIKIFLEYQKGNPSKK